jgi:hypothetical protein
MNPSDIESIEPFKLDLPKSLLRYEKSPERNVVITKFHTGGRAFLLRFEGYISTNGINDKEFTRPNGEKQVTFSIGIELSSELVEAFTKLQKNLEDFLGKENADFEVIDLVKDMDKIYIKLKVDRSGKTFTCPTNLKLSPRNYSEAAVAQKLTFIGELGGYFNLADKKAGLMLTPRRLLFDEVFDP